MEKAIEESEERGKKFTEDKFDQLQQQINEIRKGQTAMGEVAQGGAATARAGAPPQNLTEAATGKEGLAPSVQDRPAERGQTGSRGPWCYTEAEMKCRRTIKIVGIPNSDGDNEGQLLTTKTKTFFTDVLELSEGQVVGLGHFTAKRPTTLDRLKPVEVTFESARSRDFVMSQMGVLTRAKREGQDKGRLMAKYPENWLHLVKELETAARSARSMKFLDGPNKDKPVYYAQLRFADSPKLLDVYVRRVDKTLPFLPFDAALETFGSMEPHPLPTYEKLLADGASFLRFGRGPAPATANGQGPPTGNGQGPPTGNGQA